MKSKRAGYNGASTNGRGKHMLSIILLLVLAFVVLGLLLGYAASYDIPRSETRFLPENITERDPEVQQKLFEDCIEDAKSDGNLTDDEYFRCAYDIYD